MPAATNGYLSRQVRIGRNRRLIDHRNGEEIAVPQLVRLAPILRDGAVSFPPPNQERMAGRYAQLAITLTLELDREEIASVLPLLCFKDLTPATLVGKYEIAWFDELDCLLAI
jgi:hypothetical protein